MNIVKKSFCRAWQKSLFLSTLVVRCRVPKSIEGENAVEKVPPVLKEMKINNVLVVTGKNLFRMNIPGKLFEALTAANIKYSVYTTDNDPSVKNVEEGLKIYNDNSCKAIIAFGGGSPMDAAKIIGARVARPKKAVSKMKGLLQILLPIPPLFAVPTTAGSGSEATMAAVISDPDTHVKYPITDFCLVPNYAVLDPSLTVGLPPHTTAATGLDALTHSVEAYIGNSNTKLTREMSRKSIKLIFENLIVAYKDGKNLAARENMQRASFYAGISFTRAYVGYVHAVAHAIGGMYGIAHGLANAVLLPQILEQYGAKIHKELAELAELVGIKAGTEAERAKGFIDAIKAMNKEMNIPEKFDCIQDKDIDIMAKRAYTEGVPFYPVPVLWDRADFAQAFKNAKN